MAKNPTCFISYSWDSEGHKTWVKDLAAKLRSDGIDVALDHWNANPGEQLPKFMEQSISSNDFVLIICTPGYKARSDSRKGGVGYEGDIITGELFSDRNDRKYIPILRDGSWPSAAPTFCKGKYYIDLTGDPYSQDNYRNLLLTLLGQREQPPPLPTTSEILAAAEQHYRERLKTRYADELPYFIPLTGETTEVIQSESDNKASRSARRRRQRAQAEYQTWYETGPQIKRIKLNNLREGVDKYPCIILLGNPGSGKTTALEHLAYELANEPNRLPLPLRLSEFGPGMTVEAFIRQSWIGSEQSGYWAMPQLAANLDSYLEQGKLFLLFDALNEMPHENYKQRVLALRHFIDRWSANGNRFLVTCRVLDYGEELSGLQRIEIQPLTDEQIRSWLQNELPQVWQQLWQQLAESEDSHRRLLELARNPYLLTMMIDIYAEDGKLSQERAGLMRRFTQILVDWAKAKCPPEEWLDAEVQAEVLAVMAFEMQKRAGFGSMIKTERVKAVLPNHIQLDQAWPAVTVSADRVLSLAASAHLIEMPGDRSSVRFYHQLLQEYFAARELLKRDLTSLQDYWCWPWLETEMPLWVRPEENEGPLPPPPPTGWEETTILASGLAAENDDQLVQTLNRVNPVLAGRCLYKGQAKVDKATQKAVIDALLAILAQPEVALRVRIAASEVLGDLGDPRLGQLVTVPAGEFVMGSNNGGDNEKPQHRVYLPDYQIGKYPVANAEFTAFIEAGGYLERRWWTEVGWTRRTNQNWTEPFFWYNSNLTKPNQPVVGVTWYGAVAYCHWLSAETGHTYRLPTEAEWEKAARGTDGRIYPWGNTFEANQLNADEGEQKVKTTSCVGIYPTGVSPWGAYDCAGNVWEWCATKGGKPYPYDVEEDEWAAKYLAGKYNRMLRGGSWYSRSELARNTFRYEFWIDFWDFQDGFRVWYSPT